MDEEQSYSVGELAAQVGVSVRTLHHYDEIGLLSPSERTAAGYRRYSGSDAERRGLGEMYVADPRFAANYDEQEPGLAAYVRDAIRANAERAERN